MTEMIDRKLLYERIVEDSPIGMLYADREGRIRFWNAGAASIFGYPAAEAIGQSLDLIIPEKQRPRHWEGWNRVMATGVTRYGRDVLAVPAVRKDGSRISIEFYIMLLRAPTGEITGAAAMIQDVTARWNQFKELRAKIAALETRSAAVKAG